MLRADLRHYFDGTQLLGPEVESSSISRRSSFAMPADAHLGRGVLGAAKFRPSLHFVSNRSNAFDLRPGSARGTLSLGVLMRTFFLQFFPSFRHLWLQLWYRCGRMPRALLRLRKGKLGTRTCLALLQLLTLLQMRRGKLGTFTAAEKPRTLGGIRPVALETHEL